MVFATVPEALPTWKNQRATSCPAPISANAPYFLASRLIWRAFWPVFSLSVLIFPRGARYTKSGACPTRCRRNLRFAIYDLRAALIFNGPRKSYIVNETEPGCFDFSRGATALYLT